MEPEGSLPHSQASATFPYPGPAQSSPFYFSPVANDLKNIKMHFH